MEYGGKDEDGEQFIQVFIGGDFRGSVCSADLDHIVVGNRCQQCRGDANVYVWCGTCGKYVNKSHGGLEKHKKTQFHSFLSAFDVATSKIRCSSLSCEETKRSDVEVFTGKCSKCGKHLEMSCPVCFDWSSIEFKKNGRCAWVSHVSKHGSAPRKVQKSVQEGGGGGEKRDRKTPRVRNGGGDDDDDEEEDDSSFSPTYSKPVRSVAVEHPQSANIGIVPPADWLLEHPRKKPFYKCFAGEDHSVEERHCLDCKNNSHVRRWCEYCDVYLPMSPSRWDLHCTTKMHLYLSSLGRQLVTKFTCSVCKSSNLSDFEIGKTVCSCGGLLQRMCPCSHWLRCEMFASHFTKSHLDQRPSAKKAKTESDPVVVDPDLNSFVDLAESFRGEDDDLIDEMIEIAEKHDGDAALFASLYKEIFAEIETGNDPVGPKFILEKLKELCE